FSNVFIDRRLATKFQSYRNFLLQRTKERVTQTRFAHFDEKDFLYVKDGRLCVFLVPQPKNIFRFCCVLFPISTRRETSTDLPMTKDFFHRSSGSRTYEFPFHWSLPSLHRPYHPLRFFTVLYSLLPPDR